MASSGPKKPPVLGTAAFGAIVVGVAVGLVLVGRKVYTFAGKPTADFYMKLADLALQLAVVIILGGFVKALVDWGTSQRARYLEKRETRKEFMRRVRSMHVIIQNARDLINAHRSAKTWGEQSRRLMELSPEVGEISEDLKASGALFVEQTKIIEGLEAIVLYLAMAREEYVKSHEAVDSGHKDGKSLLEIIEQKNMTWVRDFMDGGKGYKDNYVAHLASAKRAMRAEVYGA